MGKKLYPNKYEEPASIINSLYN